MVKKNAKELALKRYEAFVFLGSLCTALLLDLTDSELCSFVSNRKTAGELEAAVRLVGGPYSGRVARRLRKLHSKTAKLARRMARQLQNDVRS